MSPFRRMLCRVIGLVCILFIVLEFLFLINLNAKNITVIIATKLFVSVFSVLCGFFCSLVYTESYKNRPIQFLLYTFGLAFFNLYTKFSIAGFSLIKISITTVLFDIFATCTMICLFLLISRIFLPKGYTLAKNIFFFFFIVVPAAIVLIKYTLTVFIPDWTIISSPLRKIVNIEVLIIYFICLGIVAYMFVSSSRTATMVLRYFSLGLFFSFLPFLLITLKYYLLEKNLIYYSTFDIVTILLGYLFVSLFLTASIFQYRSEKINKILRGFLVFVSFSTTEVLFIQTFYEVLEPSVFKRVVTVSILLAPVICSGFVVFFGKVLALDSRKMEIALNVFKETLDEIDTNQDIYFLTANTLKEQLQCKYVFFYALNNLDNKTNNWIIPYTDTEKEIMDSEIGKSEAIKGNHNLQIFEHKTAAVVFYREKKACLKMFIGPKISEDEYLPGELSLITRYGNLMYQALISNYTKDVSHKLNVVSSHSKILDRELKLAAFVQQSFYQQRADIFNGWKVEFYWKPMESVSGDLYDFFMRNGVLDGLAIFDVSGHGISSGLVAMLARNIVHQEFYANTRKPLEEVMKVIDNRFRTEKNNIENFMTGILVRVMSGNIELVNAAHVDPLVYRRKEDKLMFLNEMIKFPRCTVIGFEGIEPNFSTLDFVLDPGDEIIFYTDGITECANEEHVQFGKRNFYELVEKNVHKSIAEQKESILEGLKAFAGNAPANDDITFIILQKN